VSTDRKPDYGDRPAKQVVRRIFVEVLKRLHVVDDLSKSAYVGFGAHQFVDFELVHRQLGINQMTSIEGDASYVLRCQFNKPFDFVNVVQGTSATVLPGLNWSQRHVVWLDYTQRLRFDELADCELLGLRMVPGSVLAVTLNCHPGTTNRMDDLRLAVGADNVPLAATEAKLGDWGLAATQRELVTARINRALASRGDGAVWQQLLNLRYKDGARMQMIVGIVDHSTVHERIEVARFGEMEEVSADDTAVEVVLPSFTSRERQALDTMSPNKKRRGFAGIPQRDIDAYVKFYRWLDPVI